MKTKTLSAGRVSLGIVGLLLIAFALHRWNWYSTIPRTHYSRWCGNCAMAAIGLPVELGLVGYLFILGSATRGRLELKRDLVGWVLIFAGVCCNVIGAPLFALGFPLLFYKYTYRFLRSWASAGMRWVGTS